MSERFRAYYIGKEVTVLLEECVQIDGKNYTLGHTREYVKVALAGEWEANKIVTVRITDKLDADKMLAE